MELFSHPLLWALALCIILINTSSCALPEKIALVVNIVNIALHICLFCLSLIMKLPISELTLVVIVSAFAYALSYMIFDVVKHGKGGDGGDL